MHGISTLKSLLYGTAALGGSCAGEAPAPHFSCFAGEPKVPAHLPGNFASEPTRPILKGTKKATQAPSSRRGKAFVAYNSCWFFVAAGVSFPKHYLVYIKKITAVR